MGLRKRFWSFLGDKLTASFFHEKQQEMHEARKAYSKAHESKREAKAREAEVDKWVNLHSQYPEDLFAMKMRDAFRSTEGYPHD